ncbi:glycosyltransferase [Sphingomonas qomolangmaensis]|uniref:Glycosyltransferase family 2 protein n=1 Tax=Sphingomonas qomolangmaensis TaxID=2918765 RepID=A0ABY5L4K1_9SPHN|nr:glycosyltransferase family A protein [Sphingomonas qomolangmaensis]UUL81427.1 glycosyltransferase family 2 protein [Sphingomonas qomolangmaensis]
MLPRLLDALSAQRDAPAFVLCLLLDSCTDASEAIVRLRAGSLPFATTISTTFSETPNAGLARRRAMEIGLSVVTGEHPLIISTDADTVPDPEWLSANRAALEIADIAAGSVERIGGEACPTQDRIEAYYDALYALRRAFDPVPWEAAKTHHYTSAASLAFRADAYGALGGFAPIGHGEDGKIIDAAHRVGLRVRHDAAIRVRTSARRDGRAVGGLAEHLRRLDADGGEPLVAHPEDAAWRYRRYAAARHAWDNMAAARLALAVLLACEVAHIDRVAADVENAQAFATRVVPDVPGGERQVPLADAEVALARLCVPDQVLAA